MSFSPSPRLFVFLLVAGLTSPIWMPVMSAIDRYNARKKKDK